MSSSAAVSENLLDPHGNPWPGHFVIDATDINDSAACAKLSIEMAQRIRAFLENTQAQIVSVQILGYVGVVAEDGDIVPEHKMVASGMVPITAAEADQALAWCLTTAHRACASEQSLAVRQRVHLYGFRLQEMKLPKRS